MQTLYLATHFNPIYWNTAFLIVQSGALEDKESESTDYTKLAKAIGEIRNAGIKVSLVDINRSKLGFEPDVKNNQILFGLKGLANVNNGLINDIIAGRPYSSLFDFYNHVHPNKQAMLSLIKGGAFDAFSGRPQAMVEFIWMTCDKKKRLTLQNLPGLIRYNLIPSDDSFAIAKRIYEFNRYLKDMCLRQKVDSAFTLDARTIDFLAEIGVEDLISPNATMGKKAWDDFYQSAMNIFREWITQNRDEILDALNEAIFMEDWKEYGKGNISSWEMDALCFYYSDHELKDVNMDRYGLVDFFKLPEEPVVDKVFKKGPAMIPIYKIYKICGTCIAKNKTKNTVYLLTTTGVVPVKFRQTLFSLYDRQISQTLPDGTRKVVEKSWFNRGNMIMVQGIRRGDEFVTKKYKSTGGHTIYHIDSVGTDGSLELRGERRQGDTKEEGEDNDD